jgi:hypothetical protein
MSMDKMIVNHKDLYSIFFDLKNWMDKNK